MVLVQNHVLTGLDWGKGLVPQGIWAIAYLLE
jgi:hypothetical protein